MRPALRISTGALLLGAALAVAGLLVRPSDAQDGGSATSAAERDNGTCGICHGALEDMHPFAPVTCVQCHGGNPRTTVKEDAHVQPRSRLPGDERVLSETYDPDYLRFLDPGNLRVAARSCGPCHERAVYDVTHSLHATTAGHLGDGLYENGVVGDRHPPVAVFHVTDDLPAELQRPPGAVSGLRQIRGFNAGGDKSRLATHFADLPRKACMQCHLWSRGRAVRGRAGMDGDYRGEGCSACHVPYADDGLSLSRDETINHYEPGHPREHRMVRFPETAACARCHYGDASIGLSFRGLAQPVPGMPQTPDAPGLHRKRLNGVYYIEDPASTPADVHHQRGMHCVDCHTRDDTMGDGFLYTRMEDAVEIRCQTCHGTWAEYATGLTARGKQLAHLARREDGVYLTSRVTGERHRVKQARDIVRPGSPDYNPKAALAMTGDHANLECYACHSGWNPNFFGFHFDRNEAFTQLDMLSGNRTTGRVTTQEKVFSTFKHFYLGWNSHGRIAPYMVGFSSMATVHDADGRLLLDQELPVTPAGLSGMRMINHQKHTATARTRPTAECHRTTQNNARSGPNFRLAREFVLTGGTRGVRLVALDRKTPADSALVSAAGIAEVTAVAARRDRTTGRATHVFAASATDGLAVVSVAAPGFPRITGRVADGVTDPQRMLLVDDTLYVADGEAGVRVFDVASPERPRQIAHVPAPPAYDLAADGPTLFVAAGEAGLVTLDVRDRAAPLVTLGGLDVNGGDTAVVDVRRIAVLFQYSRPNETALEARRSRARRLVALGTARRGVWLVDGTEPARPHVLLHLGNGPIADVALGTVYELGSEGGAIPTQERDIAFVLQRDGRLALHDVTDPTDLRAAGARGEVRAADGARALHVARVYNPPFLQTHVLVGGLGGLQIVDVSRPAQPRLLATVAGTALTEDLDLEEFPLDRTMDSAGSPIMDVSHAGARWLDQGELLRVLGVPVLDLDAVRRVPEPRRDE